MAKNVVNENIGNDKENNKEYIAEPTKPFLGKEKELAEKILSRIKEMNVSMDIMHVCGTHQDTLVRFGLDDILTPVGIRIRQGPGCPVCVTPAREIEEGLALARSGKIITTFGDLMKVPGREGSFAKLKSKGADIRIVYSISDAVNIAKNVEREVVFMGIGFETTAPCTASAILSKPPKNFSVLCCHRTVPPTLKALVEMGEIKLDGLIEPGHVSTIIGMHAYDFLSEKYRIPQVIAGFEPIDLLMAVYMLAKQHVKKEAKIENEYSRVVKEDGNEYAKEVMSKVFEVRDCEWRGFSTIPNSGFSISREFEEYDARKRFASDLECLDGIEFKEPEGCMCAEVLRGVIDSEDCPSFGIDCTPENPLGPCMVSFEGSCSIEYKYRKKKGSR